MEIWRKKKPNDSLGMVVVKGRFAGDSTTYSTSHNLSFMGSLKDPKNTHGVFIIT
jgi:hypothetical protein